LSAEKNDLTTAAISPIQFTVKRREALGSDALSSSSYAAVPSATT